jgi:hypothetical protein
VTVRFKIDNFYGDYPFPLYQSDLIPSRVFTTVEEAEVESIKLIQESYEEPVDIIIDSDTLFIGDKYELE